MPGYPARPCTRPGCRALSFDGTGRCPDHPRQAWAKRADEPDRLRGRAAVERRHRWLSKHPRCAHCLAADPRSLVPAVEVDHVVPLSRGGRDDESNFQSLCKAHHDAKSAKERQG